MFHRLQSCRAFSLPELMAVMAIGALLLGVATHASLGRRDHQAVDTAAKHFSGLLHKARLLAQRNKAPVRVALVPRAVADPESETGDPTDIVECVLYEFVIPKAARREVAWREAANSDAVRGGDALERIPVSVPGIPEALVGRWVRVAAKPMRLERDFQYPLRLDAELLRQFENEGPEAFYAMHGWHPPEVWSAVPEAPGRGTSPSSPYPPDYHRTPYPAGYVLQRGALPADQRIYDVQRREWRPARDFWGKEETLTYFNLQAAPPENLRDLPFVEFDARGELQSRTASRLEFVFHLASRPEVAAALRFDPATGSLALAAVLP